MMRVVMTQIIAICITSPSICDKVDGGFSSCTFDADADAACVGDFLVSFVDLLAAIIIDLY